MALAPQRFRSRTSTNEKRLKSELGGRGSNPAQTPPADPRKAQEKASETFLDAFAKARLSDADSKHLEFELQKTHTRGQRRRSDGAGHVVLAVEVLVLVQITNQMTGYAYTFAKNDSCRPATGCTSGRYLPRARSSMAATRTSARHTPWRVRYRRAAARRFPGPGAHPAARGTACWPAPGGAADTGKPRSDADQPTLLTRPPRRRARRRCSHWATRSHRSRRRSPRCKITRITANTLDLATKDDALPQGKMTLR